MDTARVRSEMTASTVHGMMGPVGPGAVPAQGIGPAQPQHQPHVPQQRLPALDTSGPPPGDPPASSPPAPQQQQQQPSHSSAPLQYLYEREHGLPLVRRKLNYAELLREVRLENVAELLFFEHVGNEMPGVEGPCLVQFKDGTLAQSSVPPADFRIPYAMESHGVARSLLKPTPHPDSYKPVRVWSEKVMDVAAWWVPAAGILLTWAAVQLRDYLKGDKSDRDAMRRMDQEQARELTRQRREDDRALESRRLADLGYSVEAIVAELRAKRIDEPRSRVEELVAEAERRRAKQSVREDDKRVQMEKAEERAAAVKMAREQEKAEEEPENDPSAMLKADSVKLRGAVRNPVKEKERKVLMRNLARQVKDRLKLKHIEEDSVFFEDVAGIGDAKVELMEVVDFFLYPQRFRASGARVPRGVLLCGPPGTGKTLLARAVSGESGASFLSMNASEFVEMFVGVGAARVRDLFMQAKAAAPAIIFIDEIDAVGRKRGGSQGNDERDTTLNMLLTQMDGFDSDANVIVMAATNRVDVLDSALVRPGRFDRIIDVPLPDLLGRLDILWVHLNRLGEVPGAALEPDINDTSLRDLAFQTQRFSGAGLANLVNQASLWAQLDGREKLRMADLTFALADERLGPSRAPGSVVRQRRIAVQECATALLCTLLPAIEPVVRVTVQPRQNHQLGQTVVRPNAQREVTQIWTRKYLEEQLLTVLAGRAAEELLYGPEEMSTINQRQLSYARRIAQRLVVAGGMSEHPLLAARALTSPIRISDRHLAQAVYDDVTFPTHMAADRTMQKLLNDSYAQAREMVRRNKTALNALIEAVLNKTDGKGNVYQELDGDEVRAIIEAKGHPEDLARRHAQRSLFM